jgi:hypothetical protein
VEPRTGLRQTTLLELVEQLAASAILVDGLTPAVLFG